MEHPFESDVKVKQYWGDGNTDAQREFEEEGRQVAQEDFENTMSDLTERYFEDECASCMEDILVDYLLERKYKVTYPGPPTSVGKREEFDDMCEQVWKAIATQGLSLEDAMYLYLEIKEV